MVTFDLGVTLNDPQGQKHKKNTFENWVSERGQTLSTEAKRMTSHSIKKSQVNYSIIS